MIGTVVFCLLLSSLTYGEITVLEEKQKVAARLTALLTNQGWQYINHVTVRNISLYPKELFTGNDVFVANETAIVNADNLKKKYAITLNLLGCVYSNAVLEIVNLFRYLLLVCSKVKQEVYNKPTTSQQRENKTDNKKVKMHPCEPLIVVLRLIDTCTLMFKYIDSALMFLIDMMPTRLEINFDKSHILKLIETVDKLRDKRVGKNAFDPFKANEINEDEVGKYTRSFFAFFGSNIIVDLAPFEIKYCSMPERTPKPLKHTLRREKVSDLENKILKLVEDVTGMYYTNLGFAYNEETKKTFIPDSLIVPSTNTIIIKDEPIDT